MVMSRFACLCQYWLKGCSTFVVFTTVGCGHFTMFMNTFPSFETRQNAIRDDFKLCKEQRERCHLQ